MCTHTRARRGYVGRYIPVGVKGRGERSKQGERGGGVYRFPSHQLRRACVPYVCSVHKNVHTHNSGSEAAWYGTHVSHATHATVHTGGTSNGCLCDRPCTYSTDHDRSSTELQVQVRHGKEENRAVPTRRKRNAILGRWECDSSLDMIG